MKLYVLLMVSLFVSLNTAKSQGLSNKRKSTIESFINALFRDNKSHRFIIDNYMYVPLKDSVSLTKKETIVSALIDTARKSPCSVLSSSGYKIVSYDEYKGEKKVFSGPTRDIAIVTLHNRPAIYFYFYGGRIYSFTLMEKGKYGYFITI